MKVTTQNQNYFSSLRNLLLYRKYNLYIGTDDSEINEIKMSEAI